MSFFTQHGRTLLLTLVVVVVAVCVAYADHPKVLVGQWVRVPDEIPLELFSDGTGLFNGDNLTWKTEGKRFVITVYPKTSSFKTEVGDYSLSGYVFTVVFGNSPTIFVKKENLAEYKKKKEEDAKKEAAGRLEKLSDYFTDSRSGQKYRTVKMPDGKTWMAQNLNYQIGRSWCYGDDNSNCEKYGRLYDWNTAKTACPTGWHLPSQETWDGLLKAVGGAGYAGGALKSVAGWEKGGNGKDDYGFSALPGGRLDGGEFSGFYSIGNGGYWWTATGSDSRSPRFKLMDASGYVQDHYNLNGIGYSVRCVEGEDEKLKAEEERAKREEREKQEVERARLEREKIKNSRQPFTDTRDGKKYLTVKIGGKTWMAENLNYETGKSWCYDKRNSSCDKYGRLYDWKTAMKACPTGYHLPSREEWKALVDYAAGKEAAGEKLKTKNGWANILSDADIEGGKRYGTDDYGFSALPGGFRSGGFSAIGLVGVWWTATESGGGKVYRQIMSYNKDNVTENNGDKSDGFSVRCVAD